MDPLLTTNPNTDREFRAHAKESLDRSLGDPVRLQRLLRERYPDAVVRPRNLSGETITIWYVYRDGYWKSE